MTMAKAKTKSVRLITKDFSRARSFAFSLARFFVRLRSRRQRFPFFVGRRVRAARHQIKVCVRRNTHCRNGVGFVHSQLAYRRFHYNLFYSIPSTIEEKKNSVTCCFTTKKE